MSDCVHTPSPGEHRLVRQLTELVEKHTKAIALLREWNQPFPEDQRNWFVNLSRGWLLTIDRRHLDWLLEWNKRRKAYLDGGDEG